MPLSVKKAGIDDGKFFTKHEKTWNKSLVKSREIFDKRWSEPIENMGCLDDFDLGKYIDCGAFGHVVIAKRKENDQIYAFKLVEKKVIVKKSQIVHIKNEVKILYCVEFEFLIKMEYFFKDNVYLYLGMTYVNGGEMFSHLRRMKRFKEDLSKFYAAQVILALEYLHFNGVVHRDIKPENILLSMDGYIKLCDFGFCKKIDKYRTYTSCGTPDYLAPEVLQNKGYNYAVDWWALGILIFEMSSGQPPFMAESHIKLYQKIITGKFRMPTNFSVSLKNLLPNLIQVDQIQRFGCLKKGSSDIKSHKWFHDVDWDAILKKSLKPQYKPAELSETKQLVGNSSFELRKNSVSEYSYAFADFNV